MSQYQPQPSESNRNCWATAREKARLQARFNIRQRVIGGTNVCPIDHQGEATSTNTQYLPTSNDVSKLVTDDRTGDLEENPKNDEWRLQQSIIGEALRRVVDNDRSFFSLTRLEENELLYSRPFETRLLFSEHNASSPFSTDRLVLLGQDKLLSWFGPKELERTRRLLLDQVFTVTLLEFALLFRRYGIVGALLLGGVNPCHRGMLSLNTMENCIYKPEQDIESQRHVVQLGEIGKRVLQKFFQPIPLSLQTYILKRVFDFRFRIWTMTTNSSHHIEGGQPSPALPVSHSCSLCGQTVPKSVFLSMDTPCEHLVCELCFWDHLLRTVDDREGDVVVCPLCELSSTHTDNYAAIASDSSLCISISAESRYDATRQKYFALPRDSRELKQLVKSQSRSYSKKRPLQLAHSWSLAVSHSLGNSQDVRRDKFFAYVERGAVHHVRGCLEAGMDLEARNEYGQTGMYLAAWRGHACVVGTLLQYYDDADESHSNRSNDGTTPIYAAQVNGHSEIVDRLKSRVGLVQGDGDRIGMLITSPTTGTESCMTELSLKVSTLIPTSTNHPGAGSYTIDHVLTNAERENLVALWTRLPTESSASMTKKGGLCSVRSYYCDVEKFITRILLRALSHLPSGHTREIGRATSLVLPYMRFLSYETVGTRLAPHVDLSRVDVDSGARSTHSFLLYLVNCRKGGETTLLNQLSQGSKQGNVAARVKPKAGRLLLFPHSCPHEGEMVVDVPKLLIRGEVVL